MSVRKRYVLLPIVVFGFFCIRQSTSILSAPSDHDHEPLIKTPPLRLPTTILPTKYHLQIASNIHREILAYTGNVIINLNVNRTTEKIVLHAKQLRNFVVNLIDLSNDLQFEYLNYTQEILTDFLIISSPIELKAGQQYRLQILFMGDIRLQHFGFYRTKYLDQQNNTIPIASTQFEPTSARLAFPCFDEPAFKARFKISITHGSNYSAVSNMPIDGKPIPSSNGEMITTTFKETPLMSTYLVAFVVSNYEYISEFVNGVEHRVFFPPKSKDQGRRALKNAIASVTALENYIGINYPLPKLDHIRVEKTYGLAMENWGLITYNNKHLLSAMEGNGRHTAIKLTGVQNHEIAHQWFGNLVSPKWWTYAWLNEGFATYFGYITTDLVHPEWKIMELFIEKEVESVLHWPVSHAMTQYVENEADIKSTFDVVCYQKAASFIKMFHHAIGHKTFIKGVVQFLTKFQYSVADENDLFGALQTAIDDDEQNLFKNSEGVSALMHCWTHNEGIPVVTVIRNFENGTITFRQKSNIKHLNEKWWIPLSFATASNPDFDRTQADFILPPHRELTVDLKDINLNISNDEWLIVNKQQTGLYFVVYDDHNLELIAEALNDDHKKIHMLNRALVFRDLADSIDKDAGQMEPILSALKYLKYEQDPMPWNTASDLILEMVSKFYGSNAIDSFKGFIRDIVGDIFHRIHLIPETAIDSLATAKLIEVACKVDLPECLNYTKHLAKEYFFKGHDMDNALRDISLCQGIKYFTADEFQQLLGKIVGANVNPEDYDDIIYSIRCVESTENIKFFLNFLLGENSTHESMSDMEKMQYLSFLYVSNYFSRPVIMDFMRDNYRTLFKTLDTVENTLIRISNYVSEDGGQKDEFLVLLEHIKEYFQNTAKLQDFKIGSRIKQGESFKKKHEKSIQVWLQKYEQDKLVKSGTIELKPALTAARYIVAAGFVSKLINFV